MSVPSIVVIGGGVAGLSTALGAAELGATDVVVLEQRHLASGSTGLSAGVFNINATDSLNIRIRVRTRYRLDVYERESGMFLSRQGHLRLARLPEQVKLFEQVIDTHRELGVEPSQMLEPKQIKTRVPDLLVDDVIAGIFNPLDGHMDGPMLCSVLADRGKSLGVRIQQRTKASGVDRGKRKRHVVRTTNGDFHADIVVNAAGAWADQIGDMLTAPVPLVSQLHEVVRVRVPNGLKYVMPMVQEYIPGYEEAGYFRQDGPDSLIAGLHTYSILDSLGSEDPDNYRHRVSDEYVEAVARCVTNRLQIEDLQFGPGWTGLYPISLDGQFIVGPFGADPTIIACAGLGGHGLTSGIALGPVAAEYAVLGEARSISGVGELLPDRPSLQSV